MAVRQRRLRAARVGAAAEHRHQGGLGILGGGQLLLETEPQEELVRLGAGTLDTPNATNTVILPTSANTMPSAKPSTLPAKSSGPLAIRSWASTTA